MLTDRAIYRFDNSDGSVPFLRERIELIEDIANGAYYNVDARIHSLSLKAAANAEVTEWCDALKGWLALFRKDPFTRQFLGDAFRHIVRYTRDQIKIENGLAEQYDERIQDVYTPAYEQLSKFLEDYESRRVQPTLHRKEDTSSSNVREETALALFYASEKEDLSAAMEKLNAIVNEQQPSGPSWVPEMQGIITLLKDLLPIRDQAVATIHKAFKKALSEDWSDDELDKLISTAESRKTPSSQHSEAEGGSGVDSDDEELLSSGTQDALRSWAVMAKEMKALKGAPIQDAPLDRNAAELEKLKKEEIALAIFHATEKEDIDAASEKLMAVINEQPPGPPWALQMRNFTTHIKNLLPIRNDVLKGAHNHFKEMLVAGASDKTVEDLIAEVESGLFHANPADTEQARNDWASVVRQMKDLIGSIVPTAESTARRAKLETQRREVIKLCFQQKLDAAEEALGLFSQQLDKRHDEFKLEDSWVERMQLLINDFRRLPEGYALGDPETHEKIDKNESLTTDNGANDLLYVLERHSKTKNRLQALLDPFYRLPYKIPEREKTEIAKRLLYLLEQGGGPARINRYTSEKFNKALKQVAFLLRKWENREGNLSASSREWLTGCNTFLRTLTQAYDRPGFFDDANRGIVAELRSGNLREASKTLQNAKNNRGFSANISKRAAREKWLKLYEDSITLIGPPLLGDKLAKSIDERWFSDDRSLRDKPLDGQTNEELTSRIELLQEREKATASAKPSPESEDIKQELNSQINTEVVSQSTRFEPSSPLVPTADKSTPAKNRIYLSEGETTELVGFNLRKPVGDVSIRKPNATDYTDEDAQELVYLGETYIGHVYRTSNDDPSDQKEGAIYRNGKWLDQKSLKELLDKKKLDDKFRSEQGEKKFEQENSAEENIALYLLATASAKEGKSLLDKSITHDVSKIVESIKNKFFSPQTIYTAANLIMLMFVGTGGYGARKLITAPAELIRSFIGSVDGLKKPTNVKEEFIARLNLMKTMFASELEKKHPTNQASLIKVLGKIQKAIKGLPDQPSAGDNAAVAKIEHMFEKYVSWLSIPHHPRPLTPHDEEAIHKIKRFIANPADQDAVMMHVKDFLVSNKPEAPEGLRKKVVIVFSGKTGTSKTYTIDKLTGELASSDRVGVITGKKGLSDLIKPVYQPTSPKSFWEEPLYVLHGELGEFLMQEKALIVVHEGEETLTGITKAQKLQGTKLKAFDDDNKTILDSSTKSIELTVDDLRFVVPTESFCLFISTNLNLHEIFENVADIETAAGRALLVEFDVSAKVALDSSITHAFQEQFKKEAIYSPERKEHSEKLKEYLEGVITLDTLRVLLLEETTKATYNCRNVANVTRQLISSICDEMRETPKENLTAEYFEINYPLALLKKEKIEKYWKRHEVTQKKQDKPSPPEESTTAQRTKQPVAAEPPSRSNTDQLAKGGRFQPRPSVNGVYHSVGTNHLDALCKTPDKATPEEAERVSAQFALYGAIDKIVDEVCYHEIVNSDLVRNAVSQVFDHFLKHPNIPAEDYKNFSKEDEAVRTVIEDIAFEAVEDTRHLHTCRLIIDEEWKKWCAKIKDPQKRGEMHRALAKNHCVTRILKRYGRAKFCNAGLLIDATRAAHKHLLSNSAKPEHVGYAIDAVFDKAESNDKAAFSAYKSPAAGLFSYLDPGHPGDESDTASEVPEESSKFRVDVIVNETPHVAPQIDAEKKLDALLNKRNLESHKATTMINEFLTEIAKAKQKLNIDLTNRQPNTRRIFLFALASAQCKFEKITITVEDLDKDALSHLMPRLGSVSETFRHSEIKLKLGGCCVDDSMAKALLSFTKLDHVELSNDTAKVSQETRSYLMDEAPKKGSKIAWSSSKKTALDPQTETDTPGDPTTTPKIKRRSSNKL